MALSEWVVSLTVRSEVVQTRVAVIAVATGTKGAHLPSCLSIDAVFFSLFNLSFVATVIWPNRNNGAAVYFKVRAYTLIGGEEEILFCDMGSTRVAPHTLQ